MTWETRLIVRDSVFTAATFTAATYFYYLTAVWPVRDHFIEGPMRDYLSSRAVHVEIILTGVLFGGLIGVINRLTQTPRVRSGSIGRIVLFRTVLYLMGVGLVSLVVLTVFVTFILPRDVLARTFEDVPGRYALSMAVRVAVVAAAINFALEVERVVGPDTLWRLSRGATGDPGKRSASFCSWT